MRILRVLLAATPFLAFAPALHAGQAGPEIVVEPSEEIVLGDDLRFRATGLTPGHRVLFEGDWRDGQGVLWRGKAEFVVPESGVVDPSALAPVGGTYSGLDPAGLFWSMSRTNLEKAEVAPEEARKSPIDLRLLHNDKTLASKRVLRWIRKPGIEPAGTEEHGFVGDLFLPPRDEPVPGVLLLGGSGGGKAFPLEAQVLASKGYATLSLAYLGEPGLPNRLEKIPLEYFLKALSWFGSHPRIDGDRLAVLGASRGAELALLLGSLCPEIRAVVAFAPSSAVFQGNTDGKIPASPWTLEGKEIPFVRFVYPCSFIGFGGESSMVYRRSMRNGKALEAASIAAEKISGPVLLVSGRKDARKPSSHMAEQVLARLDSRGFPFAREHLSYDDAGCFPPGPGGLPGYGSDERGGSVRGNSNARHLSWLKVLGFLRENLGEKRR